ncbi:probable lysophospholipase BODYGUARD 3 [Triticum urartu]|uniref:AB hydrolase-1 domain-containing protein n=1 Tax=Triticum urartu TaxID=4572 RepID=A0A8R7JZZ1_TRIUA|nr:probable lysophospholipase BODYGUARD 3 [Triticum urartu]
MAAARSALASAGRAANEAVSFVVFMLLDALELLLCLLYKVADYVAEGAWRPCYCSSSAVAAPGKIVVAERGGSKVVSMLSSTKLLLEDVSDTLYTRPSLLAGAAGSSSPPSFSRRREKARPSASATTLTVHSAIVQILRGKAAGAGDDEHKPYPSPRWSDCHCANCNPADADRLFVHVEGPHDGGDTEEDVLFIHGFISSSGFWTETVLPHVSREARARRRLFAVDLLGFGRSPKPADSLYTLREHVEMIERSVIERYKVGAFHIVAHSLGSILALALAVKYPAAVRSITLVAPPYFPVPKGEMGTQYVLRAVAPRRVWPAIAFGASVACWYEHLGRTVSIVLCKHHRLWELAFRVFTLYRVKTYLMDGFFCHTHIASWHTLHNIICGSAGKIDKCLEAVRDQLTCGVTIYHGGDDELLPVGCSYAVQSKIPRANVKVIDGKDHVTIVVQRQRELARELEEIWDTKR